MTLDEIHEEWKVDSKINKLDLDESSRLIPELHAKYLSLLSKANMKLAQVEFKQKELMLQKWKWYNGKMSREEIEDLGWDPDPFNGLKILKGEFQHYVEADPELQQSEMKVKYCKQVIHDLDKIINNIQWRHATIKNMIDNRKFEAGF
jgi:hypothetical protein